MQSCGYIVAGARRPLPGPWIAGTWRRDPATGLWSCVPVVGASLLTNGDFSAWTGDNPDWWSVYAEDANNYTTQNPAGQCQIVSNGTITGVYKIGLLTAYTWYLVDFDLKAVVAGSLSVAFSGDANRQYNTPADGLFFISRAGVSLNVYFRRYSGATNVTIDNLLIKPLTLSSLIAMRNYGTPNIASFGAPVVVPAGYQNGVIGWATPDYLNGIWAYHNRTNILLEKCVNGVYTTLINTAAAYADNRLPTIVRVNPTTYQVWYNGVQVEANQTISDAGIINNTWFSLFSTGGGTVGDPVVVYA